MNVRKSTIIVVIVLLIVQLLSMLYLNIKYIQLSGNYFDQGIRYYYMSIIFYAMLSDALILTIGFLGYYRQLIFQSKIATIMAGLLSFSILLVIFSGIYLGLTIDTNPVTANVHEKIPLFLNVFFVIYIVCFIGFMVFSYLKITFPDKKPKILLSILLISNVLVYLKQSTYFEFFSAGETNAKSIIRQIIHYVLEYPMFIVAIVIYTMILVKDSNIVQSKIKKETF